MKRRDFLAALIEDCGSEVKHYVTAGRDIFGTFIGAAFIPGQLLVQLLSIFAREALAPSKDAIDRRGSSVQWSISDLDFSATRVLESIKEWIFASHRRSEMQLGGVHADQPVKG